MTKIILITGASSGMGAEIATQLSPGNHVIIHYNLSKQEAINVADKITANGGIAHLIQANLASEDGCHVVANFIQHEFGKLDILVNNAGGLIKQHSSQDITWDCMNKLFDLNTFSTIYLSSLCVPLLKNGSKPCIINITSTIIRSGGTIGPVYAAAKGAIDVFTRSLAREVAPYIRVNAVAPGVIETPFHDGVTPEKKMQEVLAITPLKMFGQPHHIANVVEMLISNEFITGQTVDVNGGLYMH